MSPDPFDRLEQVQPPDLWADIESRARAETHASATKAPVRGRRRSRRAVGLAVAAAITLVAGTAVASQRAQSSPEDQVATDGAGPTPGPGGERCPFHLDPSLTEAGELEPGMLPGFASDAYDDGTTTRHAANVQLLVGPGSLDRPPSGIVTFRDGASPGARAWAIASAELSPDQHYGPSPDPGCATAMVMVDVTDVAEDRADPSSTEDPVLAGDEQADVEVKALALLAGIRLEEPTAVDPCTTFTEADRVDHGPRSPEPDRPFALETTTPEGVTVVATVGPETVRVSSPGSGGAGSGPRPTRPGQMTISGGGEGSGVAVGYRTQNAAFVGTVRPNGTVSSDGLVISPGGTLFLLPSVGSSLDAEGESDFWPIVQCDADRRRISDESSTPSNEPEHGVGASVRCQVSIESLDGVDIDPGQGAPSRHYENAPQATMLTGTVDGRALKITVGLTVAERAPGRSVSSTSIDGEQTEAWANSYRLLEPHQIAGDPAAGCASAEVAIDATGYVGSGKGNDTFDGEAIEPLQRQAEEILAAIRVVLLDG